MIRAKKWVARFIRVSSRSRTKIISIFFGLIILAGSFSFGESGISIASDISIENIVLLTNQSRSAANQPALKKNEKLSLAAEAKADDMILHNYFSHTSPAGVTPWSWIQGKDYDYNYAGENLAMDFHSAEKMEEAWMASPTHRANILNGKYKEMGVAVKSGAINGHETLLVVVMFGSGDKKMPIVSEREPVAKNTNVAIEEKNLESKVPTLPIEEKKTTVPNFSNPFVMSPRAGEIFSADSIEIIGRGNPREPISIFDNGKFVNSVIPDSEGWFKTTGRQMSEGSHHLTLKYKNRIVETGTEFLVDRTKPNVYFHLYANNDESRKIFVEASTDKKNCLVELFGEKRMIARGIKTIFAIDKNNSSVILRISDQAGNKNFRQVSMANYFSPENKKNISDRLVEFVVPHENIFAGETGREAVKVNLGLVAHKD